MSRFALTAALGAACLGLAACGDRDAAGNNAAAAKEEGYGSGAATAGSGFPKGARIVVEKGVTYRIDADGTRVALGDKDSRIVVEKDVRYRVDPDGTRVKIDDDGVALDVDLPDVDIGINKKGNPDIDVGDKDADGGR